MKIYLLTSHICGSICFHEFLTFNLYHIHTKCLPFFRRDAPTHDDTPPHQKRKEQIAELEILENVLFNHIYLYLSKYVYIYILFIDIYIYVYPLFINMFIHSTNHLSGTNNKKSTEKQLRVGFKGKWNDL